MQGSHSGLLLGPFFVSVYDECDLSTMAVADLPIEQGRVAVLPNPSTEDLLPLVFPLRIEDSGAASAFCAAASGIQQLCYKEDDDAEANR